MRGGFAALQAREPIGPSSNSVPSRRMSAPPRALGLTALVGLLVAAGIGLWLRFGLAGVTPLAGTYAFVRHAHTHAGYYLVLFPLAWLAWHRLGARAPGPRLSALYGAAGLAAVVAFAHRGYALPSIAGSTVVGAVWLISAVRARGTTRGWLRVAPLGIALAVLFVPPIGVLTSRDPALANAIVHSFLSVLLLLVMVPSALATLRWPAPPPALWAALALAAAGFLGAVPFGPLGISLSVLGTLLARSAWGARGALPIRLAWFATAGGLMALGVQGAPPTTHRAIAAIHAMVLGPIFVTLAPPGGALTWLSLVAAGVMGASLVSVELGLGSDRANLGAALAGLAWLPGAVVGVVRLLRRRPQAMTSSERPSGCASPRPDIAS